jgi:hypothetical protein
MTFSPIPWQLFIVSLPTTSATVRMRIWRTVKALGCASLRDGVYIVPFGAADQALRELAEEANREGGSAWLLKTTAATPDEEHVYQALFDRTADYDAWLKAIGDARRTLPGIPGQDVNRALRKLRRDHDAIRQTDFFPNDASARAEAALREFTREVETLLAAGEPQAIDSAIPRLDKVRHQGRTWATRRRLWVDRVASAWLIKRFIDADARFLWLAQPSDCPSDALGFDFDGAAFTHVGERVTFEVLLASFDLEQDRGLSRLGAMVRSLDVGTGFVPEASGFEAILAGARERAVDDDQLLAEISSVLDALYGYFSNKTPEKNKG